MHDKYPLKISEILGMVNYENKVCMYEGLDTA